MAVSPSFAHFLELCQAAQKALDGNTEDPAVLLESCAAEISKGASWAEGELALAGKALMKLRVTAESKSRFKRIRAHMAQTLAKASASSAEKSLPKGVDRVF